MTTIESVLGKKTAKQIKGEWKIDFMEQLVWIRDEKLIALPGFGKIRLHKVQEFRKRPPVIDYGSIEYFTLLSLQDRLKAWDYNQLGLENLNKLRKEVEDKIQSIHHAHNKKFG